MINEKKVVPILRQEVKVDIVTSDDIKIYYTWKFQDFTARYIIKKLYHTTQVLTTLGKSSFGDTMGKRRKHREPVFSLFQTLGVGWTASEVICLILIAECLVLTLSQTTNFELF